MKINAPISLNDREKATLARITRYIPRIRFELPAKAEEVEDDAPPKEKIALVDRMLGRKKPYPY